MDARSWLITGCSSGFGRELARALIERGERVVATARRPETIADLAALAPDRVLPLALDVTNRSQIAAAVAAAERRFGRIDILVNNAGYALIGGIEETSEAELRAQFETNFFGVVAMTQAVLPLMRRQRSGRIINLSSMAGISSGLAMGNYGATKFAMAAVSESLAAECAPLGIRVSIIEPGAHRTEAISQARFAARSIDDYDGVAAHRRRMADRGGKEPGDARLAALAIIAVADADNPPLHLPLGEDALGRVDRKIDQLAEERDRWRDLILSTAIDQA